MKTNGMRPCKGKISQTWSDSFSVLIKFEEVKLCSIFIQNFFILTKNFSLLIYRMFPAHSESYMNG